jgi:hypothetical protein
MIGKAMEIDSWENHITFVWGALNDYMIFPNYNYI